MKNFLQAVVICGLIFAGTVTVLWLFAEGLKVLL